MVVDAHLKDVGLSAQVGSFSCLYGCLGILAHSHQAVIQEKLPQAPAEECDPDKPEVKPDTLVELKLLTLGYERSRGFLV